jgi:hypothetical protein
LEINDVDTRWMDLPRASEYASLPVKSLRRAISLGDLPFSKPSRKIIVDAKDIDAWLMREKRRIEP